MTEDELQLMRTVVGELALLHSEIGTNTTPTLRQTTVAGAFLHQFYNGIESILKRFGQFYEVPLPKGESFHRKLLDMFVEPTSAPLPGLLDVNLYEELEPYRQFRHIFRNLYSMQLD